MSGSPEYAHARLRARWGARPSETQWHRLESTREWAPLLSLARAGTLAHWLRDVGADTDLHALERALRRHWREAVDEVARWLEGAWQDGMRWCGWIPALAAVQQWARGDAVAPWAIDELALAASDAVRPAPAAPPLARPGALPPDRSPDLPPDLPPGLHAAWGALLRRARADPQHVATHWQQGFLELLPPGRDQAVIARTLVPLVRTHVEAFSSPATADGWAARRELAGHASVLMRRHPAEPLEAFAFVALQGLELERLRAELVARLAFPKRTLHA